MKAASVLGPLAPLAAVASAQSVIEIGIQKMQQPGVSGWGTLSKRASSSGTYIETLVNNVTGGGYYASVSVGTPAQPQTLVIDTGSSDVWVVSSDANLCSSARLQSEYGDSCGETFDASKSSTYKVVDRGGFNITYLDGTGSSGDYFADTFSIAGATIDSLQMGEATQTTRGTGIMGVGFNLSESAQTVYPSVMDQFQDQGLIKTKAFSLYLNDYRSASGSILFGGIDTDKFTGSLVSTPILQSVSSGQSSYTTYAVALRGLAVQANASAATQTIPFDNNNAVPAVLDSGTTLSFLPSSLATALFDDVGAYTDDQATGYTFVDCDAASSLTLTFLLGTAKIVVPAAQVVLDLFSEVQDQLPSNIPFSHACLFGVQSTDMFESSSESSSSAAAVTEIALLGDTFLRSAYVVYDLTHNQIAVAQANLNSTSSSIVELQATDSGIPSLTGVAATATATSGGSSGGDGAVTVTASASASSQNGAGPSGYGAPGLDVFVVAGVACLFSIAGGALIVA